MAGKTGACSLPAAAMMALVLLVGLVAANTQLESELAPPAKGRMMHRSLQTDSDECATEAVTCSLDASCSECLTHFESQYDDCREEFCDNAQTEVCCALAGEEENCTTDAAFVDYFGG